MYDGWPAWAVMPCWMNGHNACREIERTMKRPPTKVSSRGRWWQASKRKVIKEREASPGSETSSALLRITILRPQLYLAIKHATLPSINPRCLGSICWVYAAVTFIPRGLIHKTRTLPWAGSNWDTPFERAQYLASGFYIQLAIPCGYLIVDLWIDSIGKVTYNFVC